MTTASAEEARQRVLVEVARDAQAMLPLLRAELEDLGLEVVESPAADPRAAADAAPQQAPRLNFRIVVKTKNVEVWVNDPETNTIALHEVFAQADGSPLAARTAVLHAVELLGWSLRERKRHEAQSPAPVFTPVLSTSTVSAKRDKEWFVTLTPLALHSPGGMGPGAGAALDLTRQKGHFGVRLLGAGLLLPNQLALAEGKVQATAGWLGLEGVVFAKSPGSRFNFSLGAGINVLSVSLRGTTESDLLGHEDSLLTAAPSLSVRSLYALGEAFAVGLAASGMVPLRSDIIRVDEREVGRYGRLILTAGISLQAALR